MKIICKTLHKFSWSGSYGYWFKSPVRFQGGLVIVIIFRSRLTAAAGDDYQQALVEMGEYVKSQPGFIAQRSYTAADGERLTLVWWKDKETLQLWRQNERHKVVKNTGRARWYEFYYMEIAEVLLTSDFDRQATPAHIDSSSVTQRGNLL
jgi:heme-degrading monooxygenase HmoA